MRRLYTLNEAKREIKEMDLSTHHLKIEVTSEYNLDCELEYDLYMNAYSVYSDNYIDGVPLETYSEDEIKKLNTRIKKLSENYEIIRNDK